MKLFHQSKGLLSVSMLLLVTCAIPSSWAGQGPGEPRYTGDASATSQVEDTSYAVEYSHSCLGGGCHESDQQLVDEYSASFMTHVMVKCNACHGTHTEDTLGEEKPNLNGYYPGIGATGYTVGRDRCVVCHSDQHQAHSDDQRQAAGKPSGECKFCHLPHVFR